MKLLQDNRRLKCLISLLAFHQREMSAVLLECTGSRIMDSVSKLWIAERDKVQVGLRTSNVVSAKHPVLFQTLARIQVEVQRQQQATMQLHTLIQEWAGLDLVLASCCHAEA